MRGAGRLLAAIAAAWCATLAEGTIRVADFSGGGGGPACAGWCNVTCPCSSLQQAFDAARDGDEVQIVPPEDGSAIACEGAHTDAGLTVGPRTGARARVVFDCRGARRAMLFNSTGRDVGTHVMVRDLTVMNGQAGTGGCISMVGVSTAMLTGCSFVGCRANASDAEDTGGGSVMITLGQASTDRDVKVQDCDFRDCASARNGGCMAIYGADFSSTLFVGIVVQSTNFTGASAGYSGGALFVFLVTGDTTTGRTSVAVLDSHFRDCASHGGEGEYGGALGVYLKNVGGSLISVRDSEFVNCTAKAGAAIAGVVDGTANWLIWDVDGVKVQDCHGGSGPGVYFFAINMGEGSAVSVANSVFNSTSATDAGGAVYLTFPTSPHIDATVDGCMFLNTRAANSGGAISIILPRKPVPLPNTFLCPGVQPVRKWEESSSMVVTGCTFLNTSVWSSKGIGGRGGAIAAAGGKIKVVNSTITNTLAGFSGGAIDTLLSASLHLINTSVVNSSAEVYTFVRHGGAGELVMVNASMSEPHPLSRTHSAAVGLIASTAAASMDGLTNVTCRRGEQLKIKKEGSVQSVNWPMYKGCSNDKGSYAISSLSFSTHAMDIQCTPCEQGTYSLDAGTLSNGETDPVDCLPCPLGATCAGRDSVVPAPEQWTTSVVVNDTVALPAWLTRCATGYCCESTDACTRFDSCAPTRCGMLCGSCVPGTTASLGSPECVDEQECGSRAWDIAFWPFTALGIVAMLMWQLYDSAARWERRNDVSEQHDTGGLMKATFAFYQTAPLLWTTYTSTGSEFMRGVLGSVFNLHFRLSIDKGVCLWPGMTPVTLELVPIAVAFVMLIALPVVRGLHLLVLRVVPHRLIRAPPSAHVHAGALTSLVMLTYSVITSALVHLLTCTTVGGHGFRLSIQGSVECFSQAAWWQFIVAAYFVTCTLATPVAVWYGGGLLGAGQIGPRRFWLSLLLPLPMVVFWAVTCRGRGEFGGGVRHVVVRQAAAAAEQAVAAGRHESSPEEMKEATLLSMKAGYRREVWWWDAVLLLRRLVFSLVPLVLFSFPLLQGLVTVIAALIFLVWHVMMRPFKNQFVSWMETGYLSCLFGLSLLTERAGAIKSVSAADEVPWHQYLNEVVTMTLLLVVPVVGLAYAGVQKMRGRGRERRRGRDRLGSTGLGGTMQDEDDPDVDWHMQDDEGDVHDEQVELMMSREQG